MNRGTIENDDIKLNLKRTKCEKLKKFVLSIEIDLKNKTTYAQKYTLKNVVLINEVTGETYDVDYEKNYSIDVGFTQTLTFSSVMPTSIYSENYKLYFEINSYKFLYYIYTAPSELN